MEEDEVFALAADLLRTYDERDLTFLLQNWEGDWMLRGGTRAKWTKYEHPDLERRVAAFTNWFSIRQRGVERCPGRVAAYFTRLRSTKCSRVQPVSQP